jgi:two-component system cell cycle sensor histidine kinase/response regulator CckA
VTINYPTEPPLNWSDHFDQLLEENAREDSELLRLLYDINPNLVFVKDRQGRFVFANKALADVYGVEVAGLLGKSDADFNPDVSEIDHFLRDDVKVMDSQETLLIAAEKVTGPDGSSVWLQTTKVPLISDDYSCHHLLGISVDITARIAAEDRERELLKRLSRYERLDSLGLMAGGIAHDLNNILGPLVGYPDIVRSHTQNPEIHSLLDEIQRSASRATDVIANLMVLARRGIYQAQPLSPDLCITDCLRSAAVSKLVDDHPLVKLELELESEGRVILGSESHVHRVLFNVVKNAFESIEGGGTVIVQAGVEALADGQTGFEEAPAGDYFYIRVIDTGCGIDLGDQESVFDPFFTKKKTSAAGTGLGLAMVYGIVRDMGGYLDLQSTVGEGSRFTVRFPVADIQLDSAGQSLQDLRGDAHVLVIDDLQPQRELATHMLGGLGYSVEAADSGTSGIALLLQSTGKFDLVVIDMVMGEAIDGLDTYRLIQQAQLGLPCLLVSGYSETERVTLGLQEGACGFIAKPYTQAVLGTAVADALSQKSNIVS